MEELIDVIRIRRSKYFQMYLEYWKKTMYVQAHLYKNLAEELDQVMKDIKNFSGSKPLI